MKILGSCLLALLIAPAWAQDTMSQQQADWEAAITAVQQTMVFGAQDVGLIDQATLHLPEGFIFVPQPAADMYMHAIGNSKQPDRVGLIMPASDEEDWFIDVGYTESGYVADDDARDWDVDELMNTIQQGTREANKERTKRGFPTLDITGWVERPNYDAGRHQLIWAIGARDSGAGPQDPETVNYNTYLLGREGYFELNLITTRDLVALHKQAAQSLLGDVDYKQGKRYADFNPDTDHMAEYGLAALVTGVAAKKLGLLAIIGAFFLKFAKFIVLGVVVFWGAIKSLFKKGA